MTTTVSETTTHDPARVAALAAVLRAAFATARFDRLAEQMLDRQAHIDTEARAELERINATLSEAGFDYPQGAAGVSDLADAYVVWSPGGDAHAEQEERSKQAEAARDRYRAAWKSARRRLFDLARQRGAEVLTFSEVSTVNRRRCERWHPGFPDDEVWVISDWSNAMLGEAGELANVVKKLRRLETGQPGALDPTEAELVAKAADEAADVFLYLDLLCTRLGIDLAAAVVAKFNAVSIREGLPDRLPADAAPVGDAE